MTLTVYHSLLNHSDTGWANPKPGLRGKHYYEMSGPCASASTHTYVIYEAEARKMAAEGSVEIEPTLPRRIYNVAMGLILRG